MKKLLRIALPGIAAALQLPAMAMPVVDQINPVGATTQAFCTTTMDNLCGQSFEQDASNISGAGIYIAPTYASEDTRLNISIFSQYSGTPSGIIAGGTIVFARGFTGWADVFWTPAAVSPATRYYMVVVSDSGVAASVAVPSFYGNGNPLLAGNANSNLRTYDLVFRTFADDAFASQVPEPGSFALLGLGLAALGFAARKKRS